MTKPPAPALSLFPDDAPAEPAPRAPKLHPIPAGTAPQRCRGATCGQFVYWVPGQRFPLSATAAVDGCMTPGTAHDGFGVSHFIDCPDASDFSGRKRGLTS